MARTYLKIVRAVLKLSNETRICDIIIIGVKVYWRKICCKTNNRFMTKSNIFGRILTINEIML